MTAVKKFFGRSRKDVDMTTGSIPKHLITFALPLLIGNIFQQFYNMVDSWVVGNYVSDAAYAAVGSVGPIVNLLIGFFLGFSSGAGVVISQFYAAKRYDKVQETVHTAIVMTLVLGVLFTGIGIMMVPTMLRLMKMPAGAMAAATEYLTIYFAGIIGLMIYNIGAGYLRAIGDSQRPFYFLIVAAVTNTILDLLFVFVLEMGVAGVALATVIAQTLSAILTLVALFRSDTCVKLYINKIRFHKDHLIKIIKVGFPAAIQMAITSFSNVFVQSYISKATVPGLALSPKDMQTVALASWTAYSKIDQFIFLPIQSIGLAVTTFVGQNLGINDTKRAKKGTYLGLLMAAISAVVIIIPIIIFAPFWASIFSDTPDVVKNSAILLRFISPFYVCCCVNQVISAALRGSGNTTAPMIIMLSTFVGFRQLSLFVTSNFISNELLPIGMSYPLGWLACATTLLIYFSRFNMEKTRIVK